MNPKVKAKWVAALRSGRYKQGHGALAISSGRAHVSDKFCCLGVLCDLAVQAKVIPAPTLAPDNEWYSYEHAYGELPHEVMTWAGLDSADPWVPLNGSDHNLSTLNDDHRLSFKRIARLVETHL